MPNNGLCLAAVECPSWWHAHSFAWAWRLLGKPESRRWKKRGGSDCLLFHFLLSTFCQSHARFIPTQSCGRATQKCQRVERRRQRLPLVLLSTHYFLLHLLAEPTQSRKHANQID